MKPSSAFERSLSRILLIISFTFFNNLIFPQKVLDIRFASVGDTINVLKWDRKKISLSNYSQSILKYDFILKDYWADTSNVEIDFESCPGTGRYAMIINSDIIYLKEMHENPNPTSMFWVIKINNEIFESISKNLMTNSLFELIPANSPNIFEYYFKNPNNERNQCWGYTRKFYRKSNIDIRKILSQFNNGLNKDQQIQMPDKISIDIVYPKVISSLNDLDPIPDNKCLLIIQ